MDFVLICDTPRKKTSIIIIKERRISTQLQGLTLLKRIFSADTWVFRICTLLLEVSYADTRFFNMIMSWHQSDVLNEQKRSKVRIRSVNNVESIRLTVILYNHANKAWYRPMERWKSVTHQIHHTFLFKKMHIRWYKKNLLFILYQLT